MQKPKTIDGYLKLIRRVAAIKQTELKGYDKLTTEERILMGSISAEMDNILGEIENNNGKNGK